MTLYSSVNRGIYGHVARARGEGGRVPSIFLGYVEPINILQYIRSLHVTYEYIFIFLGTDEYNGIYPSALYSLIASSVNRGI
jgi:hypothetical protein